MAARASLVHASEIAYVRTANVNGARECAVRLCAKSKRLRAGSSYPARSIIETELKGKFEQIFAKKRKVPAESETIGGVRWEDRETREKLAEFLAAMDEDKRGNDR